jgi:hypothetical protein
MSAQIIGRRLLLGAATAAIAAPHAQADTSFTSFRFPATGAPAARTMPDRLAEVRNVKEYGAVGDGVTDDTAAIQATFDAAFGSPSDPHGTSNKYLNRPVFFPAGNYKVTSTLTLRSVSGGHIFGGGSTSTCIFYAGSIAAPPTLTSLIKTNGFAYCRVEGLSLSISAGSDYTVAFYLGYDHTGSVALNANTFSDMLFFNSGHGMLIGGDDYMGSENVFLNCTFSNCSYAGLKTANYNALQQTIIGGGATRCGVGFMAKTGSIPTIAGAGFAENALDIQVDSGDFGVILGCRSESAAFCQTSGNVSVVGCTHQSTSVGAFATILDQTIIDACYSLNGTIVGGDGSKVYIRGSKFDNPNYLARFSGTVGQNI